MQSLGSIRRNFAPWADPNEKPYIRFEKVTKSFNDSLAVNDFSLDIYEREFFVFLGGSGAGKSTLLRMLAGFDQPSSGRIFLDGQDLNGVPPYKRPVNMMFQSYALFPHMTVEKNIAFGLKQEGLPQAEIKDRVAEMLKLVRMTGFEKRKPHQLSGGECQRVALARSVAKRPKVLLLDEPLGALDKKLREETRLELMDLQQSLGLTFIVVTHDQEEAMIMADRIGVFHKGKILQVATPGEIYEGPETCHVAEFIGNMNMFEGLVTEKEGTRFRVKCQDSSLVTHSKNDICLNEKVTFAIRPEKIHISFQKPTLYEDNRMEGEIYDIEYLGDMTIFHVKLAGGQIIKTSSINHCRLMDNPMTWNDRVWIFFETDAGVILKQ